MAGAAAYLEHIERGSIDDQCAERSPEPLEAVHGVPAIVDRGDRVVVHALHRQALHTHSLRSTSGTYDRRLKTTGMSAATRPPVIPPTTAVEIPSVLPMSAITTPMAIDIRMMSASLPAVRDSAMVSSS